MKNNNIELVMRASIGGKDCLDNISLTCNRRLTLQRLKDIENMLYYCEDAISQKIDLKTKK